MGISGFMDACRQSVSAFLSFFLQMCVGCIFVLLQTMNMRNPRKRVKDLTSRQGCVITSKIMLRWKSDMTEHSSLEDFLLWSHLELSSPDVLLKQNVSLYCMTPDFAVFVRTSPGVNCYRSETSPFFYMAQFFHAEEVYVTSNHWLTILTSEIAPECRVPVTWLNNCGRCGSTMLCQVMEGVPGTVNISEPDAIFSIVLLAQSGSITSDQRLSMLRGAILILLYHAASQGSSSAKRAEHVFIKHRSECSALLRDVHAVCPQVRHVFMYRRQPPFLKSLMLLVAMNDTLTHTLVDSDTVAAVTSRFRFRAFGRSFYGSEEHRKAVADLVPGLTYIGILATMYCSQLKMVQDLQAEGFAIPAILYEDVLADPAATVGRLFDHLHLPRDSLDTALGSMAKASQSTVPSVNKSRPSSSYPITAREWRDVDNILARFHLPGVEEEVVFSQRL